MLTDKSPTLRGPTCQGVLGLVYQVFPLFIIVNGMVSPFINVNIKSNSVLSQEMMQKQEL